MTAPTEQNPTRRRALIIAAIAIGLIAGLAAVYGIDTFQRNAGVDPACRAAAGTASRMAPFAHGGVAAVAVNTTPRPVPELTFFDDSGQSKRLADWRGRTVLLNLWATWCVPCRKEMPDLEKLQAKLGSPDFEVVAVNIDTRDAGKAKNWLKETGITGLGFYADPTAKVFETLKLAGRAIGMPTTLIVDPQGCELGSLAGQGEWSGEDAVKLIGAALAAQKSGT